MAFDLFNDINMHPEKSDTSLHKLRLTQEKIETHLERIALALEKIAAAVELSHE